MNDEPLYELTVTVSGFAASSASTPFVDEGRLRSAMERTLRRHDIRRANISVAIVDDDEIAKLNRTHLGHEGPTDVITFDLRDDDRNGVIEGEIVASAQTAAREAAARGHDPAAELALYTVHGVLHLLGYDDHDEEEARRMHSVENEILAAMGLGEVYGAIRG